MHALLFPSLPIRLTVIASSTQALYTKQSVYFVLLLILGNFYVQAMDYTTQDFLLFVVREKVTLFFVSQFF